MRGALRRVPAPLGALLGAVAIAGVAWALLSPAWQAPDEGNHFAYAQSIAESFALPGKAARRPHSTAQDLASDAVNADQTAANLDARPTWSAAAYARWRSRARALSSGDQSDGGGPNTAAPNPPLYYLAAAAPYRLSGSSDPLVQLLAMRLLGVLCLLVTCAAAWALVGEIVGPEPGLQLAGAAVAGLEPMVSFISASVNPDALVFALWTVALWLGARVLHRGARPASAIGLALAAGLAAVTKGTGLALVPAATLAILVAARREGWLREHRLALLGASACAAVPIAIWLAVAHGAGHSAFGQVSDASSGGGPTAPGTNVRELLSYLWQYYLPNLPFQHAVAGLSPFPAYDVWIKTGWAAFGWLEVRFPSWVYVPLGLATAGALLGAAVALVRGWRGIDWARAAFFALAAGALVAGLHWTEYHQIVLTHHAINQGRYLLPLIGLGAAAVALSLRLLPPRFRGLGVGAVVGSLVALQILSLGLTAARFYA
jgi:4-amino-4-deoxy-L-arabinose transferase-like glycosyltransferase